MKILLRVLLIVILATVACRCGAQIQCFETDFGLVPAPPEMGGFVIGLPDYWSCTEAIEAACPQADPNVPGAIEAQAACQDAAFESFMNGLPPPPAGYQTLMSEMPGGNPFEGGNNLVSPPVDVGGGNSSGGGNGGANYGCQTFRLSSPTDGLPNGPVAFYVDTPSSNQNWLYRVLIYDGDNGPLLLNTTFTNGQAIDVSTGAIGGGFQLDITVTAELNGIPVCIDGNNLMFREAQSASGGGQPQRPIIIIPLPTPLPTIAPPR